MYLNPFYLPWNENCSFLFFLEGGIAKIEAKVLVYLFQQKLRKENHPQNLQIDQYLKSKGLENQDIILGLDLLMKNSKLSSP